MAALMVLLVPALTTSKSRARAMSCMNNNRQLVLAWLMYSGDNDNRLANNLQYTRSVNRDTLLAGGTLSWVNNVMDWTLNPANTNSEFINYSLLAPYTQYTASLFHSPADRILEPSQRAAGWEYRVRSVSMNAMVGDPGALLRWGVNTNNPEYQQFMRDSDILQPASIFVFLDEHPDSINDGYFLVKDGPEWVDLPASYHNGGGCLAFADGHTEVHRWRQQSTVRPPFPFMAGLPIPLRGNDLTDHDWLLRHSSSPR